MFNINDFSAALKYDGARSSLFQVQITNPIDGIADLTLPMLCSTASLPAYTNNPIEIFHFGRPIKVAGNRNISDWDVTIINDEDFLIRNALEQWSRAINLMEENIRGTPSSSMLDYKSTATVTQYGKTGDILKVYKFVGIFPIQISPIGLDWSAEDVERFQVTFSVDYYDDISNLSGA